MEALKAWLPLLVLLSIGLMVLAIGLGAALEHALYLFRRPGQLLRAVVAMYVVVPVVATFVVKSLHLAPLVALAIVLMSVSPVPPILPVAQRKVGGRQPYVLGLLVAVSVLAVVLVPLSLVLLSRVFPVSAYLPPPGVARVILLTVLVPLAAGIAIGRVAPAFARRASGPIARVGTLLLALAFLPVLALSLPQMIGLIGNGTLLAIAVVSGAGLAAGHMLGGPDPDDRSALALATLTRHPGIALAIAKASFPGLNVLDGVLLYLLVSVLIGVPYRRWALARHEAADAPANPA